MTFNPKDENSRLESATPTNSHFVKLLSSKSITPANQDDKEVALAHCLLKAAQTNCSSLQEKSLTHHLQINGANPKLLSKLSRSGLIASRLPVNNTLLIDDGKADCIDAELLSKLKYASKIWSFYSRIDA